MPKTHLWDVDHNTSGAPGNYHAPLNESHFTYDSWAEFIAEYAKRDPDCCLVFRWDWHDNSEYDEPDTLDLFVNSPYKAQLWSVSVVVAAEDEPAVRAYLQQQFDRLATLWAPLQVTAIGGGGNA